MKDRCATKTAGAFTLQSSQGSTGWHLTRARGQIDETMEYLSVEDLRDLRYALDRAIALSEDER
jgi:hypothetical protein